MNKVAFEKPDYAKLRKEGYTCVDMHTHSMYSDGLQKPFDIYKKCKKLGIGIAMTDHNEIKGALKLAKYKDLHLIPGMEATTSEGVHTLFFFHSVKELEEFFNKEIKKHRSENPYSDMKIKLLELVENSKKYNCIRSSSHPFAPARVGIHKFIGKKEFRKALKSIEFIEAINGSNLHYLNKKGVEWGKKEGKKFTAGSDAHEMASLGCAVTAAKGNDFLNDIKKDTLVIGTEGHPLVLAVRVLLKFRMWAQFPKFYIKKIIREAILPV